MSEYDLIYGEDLGYKFGVTEPRTPDGALPPWAPTVADIAKLLPAYTSGGYDDDAESAGSLQGTFDATTEPTDTEVQESILIACHEVEGRVGLPIEVYNRKLARAAATWHVCMDISSGKQPAGTDDATGEFRGYQNNFIAAMKELTTIGRLTNSRMR